MTFYVIEQTYHDCDLLTLYGYTTSIDVVRWFKYKYQNLLIEKYTESYSDFVSDFLHKYDYKDINEMLVFKLEMRTNLDGSKEMPIYVNQSIGYIRDSYIPENIFSIKTLVDKLASLTSCMSNLATDNLYPMISLLSAYLQKYNDSRIDGCNIIDETSLLMKVIEEEGNYYGDC